MRRHPRPSRRFQKSIPRRSPPDAKLVRFPCGHTDSEAQLAKDLRERTNAVWVSCSRCNLISVAIATIEER